MTLIDEFSRKCLAIRVARRINAIGVMENFNEWKFQENTKLNRAVSKYAQGNIGGRSYFNYGGNSLTLVEAMTVRNNWGSWRLFLFDESTEKLTPITFATPQNSKSF